MGAELGGETWERGDDGLACVTVGGAGIQEGGIAPVVESRVERISSWVDVATQPLSIGGRGTTAA